MSLGLALIAHSAFSQQSQLEIINNTNCTFVFVAGATDCTTCGLATNPICVPAGAVVFVPPICGNSAEWFTADVYSADNACDDCGAGGATVERRASCGVGSVLNPSFMGCDDCGNPTVTVTFTNDTQISIF